MVNFIIKLPSECKFYQKTPLKTQKTSIFGKIKISVFGYICWHFGSNVANKQNIILYLGLIHLIYVV